MPKYLKQKGPDTYPVHCGKKVTPYYRKGFRPRYRCECGVVFMHTKGQGVRPLQPPIPKPDKAEWWEDEIHWWEK